MADISVPEILKLKKETKFEVTTLGTGIAAFEYGISFADSNRRYPGQGHTDFPSIVRALKSVSYNGFISFECLPLPDSDTTAKVSIDYLKRRLNG